MNDLNFSVHSIDPDSIADKPIQLVKVNKNLTKYEVCQDGLNALRSVSGKIGVAAFCGSY